MFGTQRYIDLNPEGSWPSVYLSNMLGKNEQKNRKSDVILKGTESSINDIKISHPDDRAMFCNVQVDLVILARLVR